MPQAGLTKDVMSIYKPLKIEKTYYNLGMASPQVVHRSSEEDIPCLSFSGVWRSCLVQLEVYKQRPAGFGFFVALCSWLAAVYRAVRPLDGSQVCLDLHTLFLYRGLDSRYLLHVLWPLEPGLLRSCLSSTLLLLLSYCLEHELGTKHFVALMLGLQLGSAVLLLHLGLLPCLTSLEPCFAGLAMVMQRVNPKVHSDGLPEGLKLPWEATLERKSLFDTCCHWRFPF